jgi:hypothetical protein
VKPFDHCHYFLTALRIISEAQLCLVRQCWSIKNSWQWIRSDLLGGYRSLPQAPQGQPAAVHPEDHAHELMAAKADPLNLR